METRPLPPERVKHFVERKAAEQHANSTASKAQRGLCAGLLGQCFSGDFDARQAKAMRHSVQTYLTGCASLTNAPDPVVLAMLDWLGPVVDESGKYQPSRDAVIEARMVEHAYLLDCGQLEITLESGRAQSRPDGE